MKKYFNALMQLVMLYTEKGLTFRKKKRGTGSR